METNTYANRLIMVSKINTTHVGSLPRSKKLSELLFSKDRQETFDQKEFKEVVKKMSMRL